MRYAATVLLLAIAVVGCSKREGDLDRAGTTQTTGADNTRLNQRDKSRAEPLPLDQGESKEDIDTTARIRRMVVQDSSLSFDAKNAKILTRDGVVVLRGPVKDEHERQVIEEIARKVPSVVRVDDKLEVKNP